ncbi:putative reverse transcriptase (RNA-dependent DNA polymerase), partial [Trifolium medium]|nr:putative reverse transcriptase (RNA-dependent DNA polymerase) [Trifolium medium]
EADKVSELIEGIADLQVSKDGESEPVSTSEPLETSEPVASSETLEDTTTSDTSPEPEGEDADTEETLQPKTTFKYKSSHPEELIIGNKNSPRKTRSSFKDEDSLFGLISM